jgi:hypothetical protein
MAFCLTALAIPWGVRHGRGIEVCGDVKPEGRHPHYSGYVGQLDAVPTLKTRVTHPLSPPAAVLALSCKHQNLLLVV